VVDKRIEERGGWRGRTLGRIRALVREVDLEMVEEWKWRGTRVWSHAGFVCTGETYKNVVKMTCAKRASLRDPRHLFTSVSTGMSDARSTFANMTTSTNLRRRTTLAGRPWPSI
jgi:hypothetical protein